MGEQHIQYIILSHPPIEQTFPGMSETNAIYKAAKRKVASDYKNWKAVILRRCKSHMKQCAARHDSIKN
jgi:hypothetical protein